MSLFDESTQSSAEQRQVDRLVDGELSEADRRVLLQQLEHEPDGWRRCALAFLEAQCWRAEMGQISPAQIAPGQDRSPQSAPAASVPSAVQVTTVSRSNRSMPWQRVRQYAATLLTISASLLIAIAVGMGLRGNWSGVTSHTPGGAVLKEALLPLESGGNDTALPAAAQSPADNTSAGGWELVTLATDADGHAQTYYVPAQRRDTLDPKLFEQMPDAVSPEVQQAFEQAGHRVVEQREIVPVQLKDGRRLMVPVGHTEIHFVGRPSL